MCTKKDDTHLSSIEKLTKGNSIFLSGTSNSGDTSKERRRFTVENGQSPYAIIVTCADSRVVPEHIFNAGIGELFIVDNAGNVISDFDLGTIEYGAAHLHADTIIVMGHTGCGAVAAAIENKAHGYIKKLTDEIRHGIGNEEDPTKAEILNVKHSMQQIMKSEVITSLINDGKLTLKGAIYDTSAGDVAFL